MADYTSSHSKKIKFMTDREFEDAASILLSEYGFKDDDASKLPIPIEEIVEFHLKLQMTIDDMQALFGVDDVHGALWINQKRIGIDQRLDPSENPAMLGRYRFTIAHEIGHWQLHRHLFTKNANQLTLFPEGFDRPEYICRSSDNDQLEYQANRFASCLLMPRPLIIKAWERWRGNLEPIYLDELEGDRQSILLSELFARGGSIPSGKSDAHVLFEHACRPIAKEFAVSPDAMRIRLEKLKLLLKKRENLLF